MKKKLTFIAVALTVVASVAASAVPTFAHDDHKSFEVMTKQVDLAPTTDPTAIGQTYALTEDVFNKAGDKQVGHDGVSCTATRIKPTGSEFICVGSLSLKDRGEIQMQGLYVKGDKSFTSSITGGEGDFRNAKGQVVIHVVSDTTRSVRVELN